MKMKCLSTKQPWAWMIAIGVKDVENRSWRMKHRGQLLIQASVTWSREGEFWIMDRFPELEPEIDKARGMRGGIVGVVNVVDCVSHHHSPWFMDEGYGIVMKDAKTLPFMPCKGKLMTFDVEVKDDYC